MANSGKINVRSFTRAPRWAVIYARASSLVRPSCTASAGKSIAEVAILLLFIAAVSVAIIWLHWLLEELFPTTEFRGASYTILPVLGLSAIAYFIYATGLFQRPIRPGIVPDKSKVFVVHGRDRPATTAVTEFIHSLGLEVIDFDDLAGQMPFPHIHEVLEEGLRRAQAVVVLFTPDEEVRLRDILQDSKDTDPAQQGLQSRPNVLYEAGLAVGSGKNRTMLVHIGESRSVSDIDRIHAVKTLKPSWQRNLAKRLQTAGCALAQNPDHLKDANPIHPTGLEKAAERESEELISLAHNMKWEMRLRAQALDPLKRSERLATILHEYGGPTARDWRTGGTAPEYKLMKAAEKHDEKHPLARETRVYVQHHYDSPYNGLVGTVAGPWDAEHHYWVNFQAPNVKPKYACHVMYLTRLD